LARWIEAEIAEAARLIAKIEGVSPPRQSPNPGEIVLRLSQAAPVLIGMRSTFRALPIRQLSAALGFSENRVFEWRLDHKLVQALVLNHYLPGAIPVTCGLRRFAGHERGEAIASRAALEFDGRYVIKAVLGHSSGEKGNFDISPSIFGEAAHFNGGGPIRTSDETFIIQQRIAIQKEYRVHSIETDVVEDMTFHRFGTGNIPGERDSPNAFVQGLLNGLPAGIVNGSLLGWDVALTEPGEFQVVEVNFSGCHPVHLPGFHCSGFYQDVDWGASMIARLLRYLEEVRGLEIQLVADVPEKSVEKDFYGEVNRWRDLFRNRRYP
jgi:hypothetical protein